MILSAVLFVFSNMLHFALHLGSASSFPKPLSARQEQEYLDNLDRISPAPVVHNQVDEAAQAIDDSVQRLLAAAQADVKAELEREEMDDTTEFAVDVPADIFDAEQDEDQEKDEPAEQEKAAVHHIDFGNLQFGKDYEIK